MNRRTFLASSLGAAALERLAAAATAARSNKIVLIGGKKSHGEGQHDFPAGIPLLASFIQAAAPFHGMEVAAFPDDFPADLSRIEGAATVLLYLDGFYAPPPLLEPGRIAALQKAMDTGAGLICLHQASTVPLGDTSIPFIEWLGAKRNGMFDRATEPVHLKPETPSFPVCRGMEPFTYEDEFYPSLIFTPEAKRVTPILRARLPKEKPADHILAWAYERPNGGRSFGFTGCHYISAFHQPQVRKMILNAICWTSGRTVPAGGVVVESAESR
jgi:type 1 glutamine amidotransferase